MTFRADYKEKRTLLEKNCVQRTARRDLRKKGPWPHYVTELIATTEYGKITGGTRFLSPAEQRRKKDTMQRNFPNTVIRLDKYNGIDQESEGACSFVSFLNLLNITGKQNILKQNVIRQWKRTWQNFGIDAASDIGTVLDIMIENKCFKTDPHSILKYVPIRSEGRREKCYNEDYWIKDISIILRKYRINNDDYNECPWIYQAANLIESLIDKGVPVEINAMEHSRTCIGYNDRSLIFADNWGMNYEEITRNPYNDSYSAGFSTIDKWAIYTWIRDLVYIKSESSMESIGQVASSLMGWATSKASSSPKRRTPARARSPPKRRTPARERSPPKRRTPARARSPPKRRTPTRERSPPRRRSPTIARSPPRRRSPTRARSPPRRRSPTRELSPSPRRQPSPRKQSPPLWQKRANTALRTGTYTASVLGSTASALGSAAVNLGKWAMPKSKASPKRRSPRRELRPSPRRQASPRKQSPPLWQKRANTALRASTYTASALGSAATALGSAAVSLGKWAMPQSKASPKKTLRTTPKTRSTPPRTRSTYKSKEEAFYCDPSWNWNECRRGSRSDHCVYNKKLEKGKKCQNK